MKTADVVTEFDGGTDEFMGANFPYDTDELEPKLWNDFLRITMVSKRRPERLTLDINLQLGWGDSHVSLPGIAIAEVKQEGFSVQSDFIRQMRAYGVRPKGFSKYCAGVYMLYDGIKSNRFKPRILLVNKLMQMEETREYVH